MNSFQFDGNWEYRVNLPAFAVFLDQRDTIKLEFEDDLTDNSDPYPEQMNTLKYIFENQERIVGAIVERTLEELPKIIDLYDLQQEEKFHGLTVDKVKTLICFNAITINIVAKDLHAYFDVTGSCAWDEDHGLDILFHKDRIISFGEIDGSSYWDAVKDNGTYELVKNGNNNPVPPRKYAAHPKYNTLKPSHRDANETYEHTLISRGLNDQFIKGVESGEIDINGKYESQNKTFLEAACWFNNNEIVEFLLGKSADVRYALHQCVVYNSNYAGIDLLLKYGADVNCPDQVGSTVLYELVRNLDRHHPRRDSDVSDLELKEQIAKLIKAGADPFKRNSRGDNCFDAMRLSSEAKRTFVNEFLERCLREVNR